MGIRPSACLKGRAGAAEEQKDEDDEEKEKEEDQEGNLEPWDTKEVT